MVATRRKAKREQDTDSEADAPEQVTLSSGRDKAQKLREEARENLKRSVESEKDGRSSVDEQATKAKRAALLKELEELSDDMTQPGQRKGESLNNEGKGKCTEGWRRPREQVTRGFTGMSVAEPDGDDSGDSPEEDGNEDEAASEFDPEKEPDEFESQEDELRELQLQSSKFINPDRYHKEAPHYGSRTQQGSSWSDGQGKPLYGKGMWGGRGFPPHMYYPYPSFYQYDPYYNYGERNEASYIQGGGIPRSGSRPPSSHASGRTHTGRIFDGNMDAPSKPSKRNRSTVVVNEQGYIDTACSGKNVWHQHLRAKVLRTLDVSIIDFASQNSVDVQQIIAHQMSAFEYEDCGVPLQEACIRDFARKILKTERNNLKRKWEEAGLGRKQKAPPGVDAEQYIALIQYWLSEEMKNKSEQLTAARSCVKNVSHAGRGGKAQMAAKMKLESGKSSTLGDMYVELTTPVNEHTLEKSTSERLMAIESKLLPTLEARLTGKLGAISKQLSLILEQQQAHLTMMKKAIENSDEEGAPRLEVTLQSEPLHASKDATQVSTRSKASAKSLQNKFSKKSSSIQVVGKCNEGLDAEEVSPMKAMPWPETIAEEVPAVGNVAEAVVGMASEDSAPVQELVVRKRRGRPPPTAGKKLRQGQSSNPKEAQKNAIAQEYEAVIHQDTLGAAGEDAKLVSAKDNNSIPDKLCELSVLMLDPEDGEKVVATGWVQALKGVPIEGTCHGKHVSKDYYVIRLGSIYCDTCELMVPNMEDMPPQTVLGQAKGCAVMWHQKYVQVGRVGSELKG